jgi:hypothetical protein
LLHAKKFIFSSKGSQWSYIGNCSDGNWNCKPYCSPIFIESMQKVLTFIWCIVCCFGNHGDDEERICTSNYYC